MKYHRKLLLCFLLALVFVLSFNIHTAYAQDNDEAETIQYGAATYVSFYGYDPQKLPPTKYPDLEQTAKDAFKIWGGPYLTTEDNIYYSFVNTSEDEVPISVNYDIEIEINGQWYLILSECCTFAVAWHLSPGGNIVNSVRV
jgi:hypothetical protein